MGRFARTDIVNGFSQLFRNQEMMMQARQNAFQTLMQAPATIAGAVQAGEQIRLATEQIEDPTGGQLSDTLDETVAGLGAGDAEQAEAIAAGDWEPERMSFNDWMRRAQMTEAVSSATRTRLQAENDLIESKIYTEYLADIRNDQPDSTGNNSPVVENNPAQVDAHEAASTEGGVIEAGTDSKQKVAADKDAGSATVRGNQAVAAATLKAIEEQSVRTETTPPEDVKVGPSILVPEGLVDELDTRRRMEDAETKNSLVIPARVMRELDSR